MCCVWFANGYTNAMQRRTRVQNVWRLTERAIGLRRFVVGTGVHTDIFFSLLLMVDGVEVGLQLCRWR